MSYLIISFKKLFKLLIDRNIKKKDLCKYADVSPATLTKMRGNNPNVNVSVLIRICQYLDVSLADILEIKVL